MPKVTQLGWAECGRASSQPNFSYIAFPESALPGTTKLLLNYVVRKGQVQKPTSPL